MQRCAICNRIVTEPNAWFGPIGSGAFAVLCKRHAPISNGL